MDDASLPAGFRIELAQRFDQAQALVRDKEPNATQTALFEVPQKIAPALQVLFRALGDPKHMPEVIGSGSE